MFNIQGFLTSQSKLPDELQTPQIDIFVNKSALSTDIDKNWLPTRWRCSRRLTPSACLDGHTGRVACIQVPISS